jgi:hypothetical protein
MMKRSLGQKIFFAIFGTFGRYITNLRGTFVENVKKVKNQPTLAYSTGNDNLTHFSSFLERKNLELIGLTCRSNCSPILAANA